MTEERITSMMGDGRWEMVKLSSLTYKRSRVSSHVSRRHCSRVRMVEDF